VREPHLDLFALTPRLFEGLGAGEGTSDIASGFVLIAWNPAKRALRTAQRFEFAAVAIMLPRQIKQCGSVVNKCPGVRVPTKPAMHSNLKPAGYSDRKPATLGVNRMGRFDDVVEG